MVDQVIENNQVTVMGEVVSNFSYSHEIVWGRILHGGHQMYETERQF